MSVSLTHVSPRWIAKFVVPVVPRAAHIWSHPVLEHMAAVSRVQGCTTPVTLLASNKKAGWEKGSAEGRLIDQLPSLPRFFVMVWKFENDVNSLVVWFDIWASAGRTFPFYAVHQRSTLKPTQKPGLVTMWAWLDFQATRKLQQKRC